MSHGPLEYDQALEIIELRRAGMTITNIKIAMQHFRGVETSHHQVRYLSVKAGIKRPHGRRERVA